jgi:hypothetical protein
VIYRALLEDDFEKLPRALRVFHSAPGNRCATGMATVRHENAFLAWVVGFPAAGEQIPLRLDVSATEDEETWTRWFGGAMRRSTQRMAGNLLMESAGPVRIGFRIRASESGMQFELRRARLWGIPIPLRIEAVARGGETSWEVEVRVAHVGSYRGVLAVKL